MQIARMIALAVALLTSRTAGATLTKITSFGANPGALNMYEYVPTDLPSGRPLVVVLHGCTQTAASMEAAGWNKLADQYKFAVVYPEQTSANNPVTCFNWAGEYGDTANLVRGQGENQSIISMIDTAIAAHSSDTTKVYIVGFSAGGAFVEVMLATWPERFAGAAIMSGLPYRCATSVSGAYSCQSPGVSKTAQQWGDLVRGAATYSGPRAPIQLWHGTGDSTVKPMNLDEEIKQWTNVLGIDATVDETEMIGNVTRTAYKSGGAVVLEAYSVPNMGHATAVGSDPLGTCVSTSGAYFEDRSICSTLRAARFFGLTGSAGPGGGGGADVAPPTVAFLSPTDGSEASGQVTIVVAANDDVAMGAVSLTIDGTPVGTPDTDAPYQFDWDATAAGPGQHVLVANATDTSGNVSMASATVNVPAPGGGGGDAGGGGGDDGGGDQTQDLPGCGLDAGGGGGGFAVLGIVVGLALSRRRRA